MEAARMNEQSKQPSSEEPVWVDEARDAAKLLGPAFVTAIEMFYKDEWEQTGCTKLGFTMLSIAALHAHLVKAAGESAEKERFAAMMQGIKTYVMMFDCQ